jgi:monothiol glutaredoxin
MSDSTQARIQQMVTDHRVLLFMKGTPDAPQCGFSAVVANLIKDSGVPFASYNVLVDPAIREGVKVFGNWPTIPQLYVDGELVGGRDVVVDYFERGELLAVLKGEHKG